MKKKRVLIPVKWTDVVMERVPIKGGALKAAVPQEAQSNPAWRGNYTRATRFASNTPRRMSQVLV
jgi:hypothetical protein